LTNGSVFAADYSKDLYRITDKAKPGSSLSLLVETAANHLFGVSRDGELPRSSPKLHGWYEPKIEYADLCLIDHVLWHLMLDIDVLLALARDLPEDTVRRHRIVTILNEASNAFGDNPANGQRCRDLLAGILSKKNGPTRLTGISVGHSHIDTGWLWRVRETVRKTARTYASQLALLEQYPTYIYGASQPVQYQMMKEHYPELYQKVKAAVKSGRWELQGAMWVEADCNLISGESMVRQVLHAKNFFRDEFGEDVRNLWLPDVFGYSANLPQILRRSGVEFFLTQKLSWSQFNVFPHTTFLWRGIDGSEVIAHFPPEDNYNSALTPEGLRKAEHRFREKDRLDEFMVLFGIGDGGGGPKEEYVERGLRMADLEGVPACRFGTAREFFSVLDGQRERLDRWTGELYLELHRATLTTQARMKRLNRLCENSLRSAEFLASLAPLASWPAKTLDAAWKKVLLNQFHDIIPGSSIHAVYEDAWKDLESVLGDCDKVRLDAAAAIMTRDSDCLTLVNPLSIPTSESVTLPAGWKGAERTDGAPLALQTGPEGLRARTEIPALSSVTLKRSDNAPAGITTSGKNSVLENRLVRYEFDARGILISAFDKVNSREILAGRGGNVLSVYEDTPNDFDAWDIDWFYTQQRLADPVCTENIPNASGPVGQSLRFVFTLGSQGSLLIQTVSLGPNSARLDFSTTVDWKEHHKMLRVSFDTAFQDAEPYFDIQYGWLRRPGHDNTSWDFAMFETVGQKFAGLATRDYGAALLNDCKYGYKVKNGVIDLNLLRSPSEPDPMADIHMHEFTYAFLPHAGDLPDSDVIPEAERLNNKPVQLPGLCSDGIKPPFSIVSESVSLAVLKKAEKEDCLVIRLVETRGRDGQATLRSKAGALRLVETDLVEWKALSKTRCAPEAVLTFKPFEIRTFKILPE
jgi:alpha-mannosidase